MSAKTKKTTNIRRQEEGPLSHLIPPAWASDDYINRKIGGKRDVDILAKARTMRMNTLIYGPTGPGKTSAVLAYCAEFQRPFYSVPCNGAIDTRQLFGSWVPTEEAGRYERQEGPVTLMVRNGGVLYLDEMNFMPPRIAASMHSLLDKRRTLQLVEFGNEVIVAHDDFQVIGSYNPDYEGTRPLNEAFKNRFGLKLFFDYDQKIEVKLVSSDVLLAIAGLLRESHNSGEIETPVSTNMLMEFEDIAYDIGFDFAVENFLNAFSPAERSSVKEVLTLHRVKLESDFNGNNGIPDAPTLPELKKMTVAELKGIAAEWEIDVSSPPFNKAGLFNKVAEGLGLIDGRDAE